MRSPRLRNTAHNWFGVNRLHFNNLQYCATLKSGYTFWRYVFGANPMDRDPARLVKAKFSKTSSKTVSAFCFEYFTLATLRFYVLTFSPEFRGWTALIRRVQGSWEGNRGRGRGRGGYWPLEEVNGLLGRSESGTLKCEEMNNWCEDYEKWRLSFKTESTP